MIMIWVTVIVVIQQIASTPLFSDKIVGLVEDVFYDAKDLVNINEMMIIDKIAAKMDEAPPFKGTNASVNFQNYMYTLAELPMALSTDVVESVAKVDGTIDKFEQGMHGAASHDAITEADKDES